MWGRVDSNVEIPGERQDFEAHGFVRLADGGCCCRLQQRLVTLDVHSPKDRTFQGF